MTPLIAFIWELWSAGQTASDGVLWRGPHKAKAHECAQNDHPWIDARPAEPLELYVAWVGGVTADGIWFSNYVNAERHRPAQLNLFDGAVS